MATDWKGTAMRRRTTLGALFVGLLAPAVWAEEKTEYMAIFMQGKKLGHVAHTRQVAGGKVITTEDMTITISRMGVEMTVRQVERAEEAADGKPLAFKSTQDMGIMPQTIEGIVGKDGTVEVKTTSGENTQTQKLAWPEGALLPEGLRLLGIRKGLKSGTKYTAKAFTGMMLKAMDMEIAVGETKDVDLLGRVVRLTEVGTVMTGPSGRIEGTTYVNEDLDAFKTVIPMLGAKMEMIACTREVAMSPADPMDFFDRLLALSPTPLEGVGKARSITYTIRPSEKDAKLEFLTTPNQKVVQGGDGSVTVTVAPVGPSGKGTFPYQGTDADAQKALKPTRHLQSDAKEIAALAKIAVDKAADAASATKAIEAYVGKYIDNKNLSVGYASALEVAKSKQGDCTEHAVLAAAMCRAVGVPAQVVTGVAYVSRLGERTDVFVPHAWFRAYIGGQWVDHDAALRGFDAGHIALTAGDGDPEEFFRVVQTLGNFGFARIEVNP